MERLMGSMAEKVFYAKLRFGAHFVGYRAQQKNFKWESHLMRFCFRKVTLMAIGRVQ